MLSLKPGVNFVEISDRIIEALPTIVRVYRKFGSDTTITSARDGVHMRKSKHYSGEAIDLRTTVIAPMVRPDLQFELQTALGRDYDVILETKQPHIHVEFDEK